MEENSNNIEMEKQGRKMSIPMLALGFVILIVVGIAVYLALGQGNDKDAMKSDETAMTEPTSEAESMMKDQNDVLTVELTGKNFEFSKTEIRVKKGQRVKIVFTSEQGTHDWAVDEFNAATKTVNAGQTSEIEFVASQAGEFEYYCNVANHRTMGMVGKLIVE